MRFRLPLTQGKAVFFSQYGEAPPANAGKYHVMKILHEYMCFIMSYLYQLTKFLLETE